MAKKRTNIRAKIRQAQHESFVGRAAEKREFLDLALKPKSPRFNVFSYWGIGGIGKTILLSELQIQADIFSSFVGTTSLETAHSPIDLMRAWREDLPDRSFRVFDRELRRYARVAAKLQQATGSLAGGALKAMESSGVLGGFVAGAIGEERLRAFLSQHLSGQDANIYIDGAKVITAAFTDALNDLAKSSRVFLVLDYYEVATPEIDSWLQALVASDISEEVVLVTASREPLRRISAKWVEIRDVIYERELTPLSEPEVAQYLTRKNIQNATTRSEIERVAAGVPWALALAVEMAQTATHDFELNHPEHTANVRSMVVARFLSQLDDQSQGLRRLIETAALVAWFDHESLEALTDDFSAADFERLTGYSFVSMRDDGKYAVKDVVSEIVSALLEGQRHQYWQEIHQKAARYHDQAVKRAASFGELWQKHFLELIRHLLDVDPAAAVHRFDEEVADLPAQVWMNSCGAALSLVENHAEAAGRSSIQFHVGQVMLATSRLDRAEELFSRVVNTAQDDTRLRFQAYAGLIDVEHRRGEIRDSFRIASDAYAAADEAGSCSDAAVFAARAAEMAGSLGNERVSRRFCRYANEQIRSCADPFAAGQAEMILAYTYIFAARYDEGKQALDNALGHWSGVGYEFGVAQLHSAQAWLGWLVGDISEGMDAGRLALDYFRRSGDVYNQALAALNLAELYRQSSRSDEAIRCAHEASELFLRTGGVLYHAIAQYRIGRTYLDLGDPRSAIPVLEESVRLQVDKVGERYSHGLALLYLAEAYVAIDDPRGPDTLLAAEMTLTGGHNKHGRVFAIVAVAIQRRRLDQTLDIRTELDRARDDARRAGFWDIVALSMTERILIDRETGADVVADLVATVAAAERHSEPFAETIARRLVPAVEGITVAEIRRAGGTEPANVSAVARLHRLMTETEDE